MSFDFKPVKTFLIAEIAALEAFKSKLQQILDFLPDDSSQLTPPTPVDVAVPTPPMSSVAPPPDYSSEPPPSYEPPTYSPPDSLIPSIENTIPAS